MHGGDVGAIILELRKVRVPGQEPILRILDVLNEKIKLLETKFLGLGQSKPTGEVNGTRNT